jgi:prepilin-type N-terminal cleavage/methylation domain-containing protein
MIEPVYRDHRAFTLMELLATITIISLLAALLFPAVNRATTSAKIAKSTSNLRQIGVGLNSYLADQNGRYPVLRDDAVPGGNFWSQAVTPYLGEPDRGKIYLRNPPDYYVSKVLMDPLVATGKHHFLSDYGANPEVFRVPTGYYGPMLVSPAIDKPSRLVSIATSRCLYNGKDVGSWYFDSYNFVHKGEASSSTIPGPDFRANGAALALFCDGHTESIAKQLFVDNREQYIILHP